MSLMDRVIASVSPEWALRRADARMKMDFMKQIRNSGYSESGASVRKSHSLRGSVD